MIPATRRGFLRRTLGASWTAGALLEQSVLRAAAARGQAGTAETGLFRLEKMAEGVYGAIAKPAAMVNCNAVIFENERDLLVVDTHSKPSAAAALLRQIRAEITTKPVKYLVNSHFHFDHVQGNPAVRRDSPGVQIIASEATRRYMVTGKGAGLQMSLGMAAGGLDGYKKALAEAKTEGERAELRRVVADTEGFLQEMKSYAPELPDLTVAGDLTIHDKAHELRIVFRGRGHTEGDVSVYCPQKRVAATGDLAHGTLPYIGDGFPLDWPKTLDGLMGLEFDVWLGGHGGVQRGKAAGLRMRGYLAELNERVAEGLKAGKSLEVLQKELRVETLRSMGGGYKEALLTEMSAEEIAGSVAGNVEQIAAKLKAKV